LFETKRLRVRRFTPNDYTDLFAYLSEPSVYIFEPGKPISLEEAKNLTIQRSKGSDFIAVELKKTRKMIGHLYFKQVEPLHLMTWELGYIFNPKFHRKGYGSEAAAAWIRYAFVHYDIHRIMARCNPKNKASWKLLNKIGFKREGCFTLFGFVHTDENGSPIWTDVYEYSLIRDWIKNLQEEIQS
jgi:RimJ/RimL family protein N-acetyltransferase